jgi:hypothetical protein
MEPETLQERRAEGFVTTKPVTAVRIFDPPAGAFLEPTAPPKGCLSSDILGCRTTSWSMHLGVLT